MSGTSLMVRDDLGQLAAEANRAHARVVADLTSATEQAFAVGAALNGAFALVEEGKWEAWLAENFDGSRTMSTLYRRMDLYRETLASNGITTIAAAKAFLAEAALCLQRPDTGGARNLTHARILTPAEIAEIKALRKAGLTQKAIAETVGVGKTTVQYHTTSGEKAKRRESERRRLRRRAAEREALRRAEELRAAKKASGDLGEFYARIRVLAQDLDRAITGCKNREVRSKLATGYHYLQRVEGCVTEALRTPAEDEAA